MYQKNGRWYADFRDLGGSLEALKPSGEGRATTDLDLATALVAERVRVLEGIRRGIRLVSRGSVTTLASFTAYHLKQKHIHHEATDGTLEGIQRSLERAIAYFCNGGRELPRDPETGDAILAAIRDRALASIRVKDVKDWAAWLRTSYSGRRGSTTLSAGSIRHCLNALSNLYARAGEEERVPPGYNSVAAWGRTKPKGRPKEARWLEVHEAALLLQACRLYDPSRADIAVPDLYALVARPQLEEILTAYLEGPSRPKEKLLFPSRHPLVSDDEGRKAAEDSCKRSVGRSAPSSRHWKRMSGRSKRPRELMPTPSRH